MLPAPMGQDSGWQQPWGSALRCLCSCKVSLAKRLDQLLTLTLQKPDSESGQLATGGG